MRLEPSKPIQSKTEQGERQGEAGEISLLPWDGLRIDTVSILLNWNFN